MGIFVKLARDTLWGPSISRLFFLGVLDDEPHVELLRENRIERECGQSLVINKGMISRQKIN